MVDEKDNEETRVKQAASSVTLRTNLRIGRVSWSPYSTHHEKTKLKLRLVSMLSHFIIFSILLRGHVPGLRLSARAYAARSIDSVVK